MSMFERIFGGLALVTILVINMWYTSYVNERSQQRFEESTRKLQESQCEDYAIELALYRENPPDSPVRIDRKNTYERLWNAHCA